MLSKNKNVKMVTYFHYNCWKITLKWNCREKLNNHHGYKKNNQKNGLYLTVKKIEYFENKICLFSYVLRTYQPKNHIFKWKIRTSRFKTNNNWSYIRNTFFYVHHIGRKLAQLKAPQHKRYGALQPISGAIFPNKMFPKCFWTDPW